MPGGANVQKTAGKISNTNISTTLTPPEPPGVFKEANLSIKVDFGSLVH